MIAKTSDEFPFTVSPKYFAQNYSFLESGRLLFLAGSLDH